MIKGASPGGTVLLLYQGTTLVLPHWLQITSGFSPCAKRALRAQGGGRSLGLQAGGPFPLKENPNFSPCAKRGLA
jgi:hypothetical protein